VIRAVLALEGGLVRGALAYVLSIEDDIEVVAEFDELPTLLTAIQSCRPDVTIVDRGVLGVAGLAGAVRACTDAGPTRLLVLVSHRHFAALGADVVSLAPRVGLLDEDVTPDRVVQAVRQLAAGEPVLDTDFVIAALEPGTSLTAREMAVLRLAAEGLPVKEIAMKLSLSPGTVRNHLARIGNKIGARTRMEIVAMARKAGWI